MEEGIFSHTSSINVNLEAKVSATICIANFGEVIEDITSGDFIEKVMIVQSKSIPFQTTSRRSPQMIKFGVKIKGAMEDSLDMVQVNIKQQNI